MLINKFGKMDRQSADTEVVTRLLLNGMIVGDGSRIQVLPGPTAYISSKNINPTGTITLGPGAVYKHSEHAYAANATIAMIYDNKLYIYYASTAKWYLQTWNGLETADFNFPIYWDDRGRLMIGGGADGIPATLYYINREKDVDLDGYFENRVEYVGFYFGENWFPKFTSDFYGGHWELDARFTGTTSIKDAGLTYQKLTFLMCQFVYSDGSVSIPDSDSMISISRPDYIFGGGGSGGQSNYSIVRIAIPAGGFDPRIRAIDIYVATMSETGVENKIVSIEEWSSTQKPTPSSVDKDLFSRLNWRFLRRIDINQPSVLWSGILNKYGSYARQHVNALDDAADVTINNFPVLSLTNRHFKMRYRDYSGGAWTINTLEKNVCSSAYYHDYYGIDAWLYDWMQAQIIADWTYEVTGTEAMGVIEIVSDTAADFTGKTITIDGIALIENTHWTAGANAKATAASIVTAINTYVASVDADARQHSDNEQHAVIWIFAATKGVAGNSITLASDCYPFCFRFSGDTLIGGRDGNYFWIMTMVRFEADSGLEAGDPIDTTQPYGLIEEYNVRYEFASMQDRRGYYLDCTTDERRRNAFMWSEIDRPGVIPNRNVVLLNTSPGEESRGLATLPRSFVALYEKSAHYIRLTGEPIQYDEEDGHFSHGCLSKRSWIVANGTVYWCSYKGLMSFSDDQGIRDLTEAVLKDDYMALIANEYAANSNSYAGITAGFSEKYNMIFFTFPNSNITFDGYSANILAYDISRDTFIFVNASIVITDFIQGYGGVLYAVNSSGILDFLSIAGTIMRYRTGMMTTEADRLRFDRVRLRYKGTASVKILTDGNQIMNDTFPTKSSMDYHTRTITGLGETVQVEVSVLSVSVGDSMQSVELIPPERHKI